MYFRPYFKRTGQEEKSDGGEVSSHPAEFALIVLLATVRPLPWTKSFNFEGARGGVLFQGFGLVMVFFFLILVCVRVCASCLGCTFTLHLPRDGLPLGQPLSGPLDSGRRPCWRLCLLGPLAHILSVCSLLLALLTAAWSSSACGNGKRVL